MPLFLLQTSSSYAPELTDPLMSGISRLLAEQLGKPESYVMTSLAPAARMTFGGTQEPCCYGVIKNVGPLSPALTQRLTGALTERLSVALGVPPARIYLQFVEAQPHHWGHDGETFA